MKNFGLVKRVLSCSAALLFVMGLSAKAEKKSILFIAGDTKHRHGFHEYKAGSILLADALNESGLPVEAKVHWYGWPEDESIFDGVDACIIYADNGGDFGEKYRFLDKKYKEGMAIMFMHYGVHPTKEIGEEFYKKWIGGYFADAFSVNPSWVADLKPKEGHPVGNGIHKPVRVYDELYWNLDLADEASCGHCYALATAVPTEQNMIRYGSSKFWNKDAADKLGTPQSLVWCADPEGGPRGAGFVGGHYHRNWAIDDYRKLILNTIAWVARLDVPPEGVPSKQVTKAMLNENLNRPDFPEEVELPTPDLLTQEPGKKPVLGPDGRVPPRVKKKPAPKNPAEKKPAAEKKTKVDSTAKKPAVKQATAASAVDVIDIVRPADYKKAAKMAWPPEAAPVNIDVSKFQKDDSLEVTLWAKSPQLYNPTNMSIDPKGNIWVTEGVNYREKLGIRREKGDRIMVLSDTDGDGVADKSTVFHQDPYLDAPLGIAVFDNRIIVSQPPDLIAYRDVNRNLVYDEGVDDREVLLTGFNGRQHDHSLHSVTAGPDGKLYFNAGNCGAIFTDNSGKTFRMNTKYRGGASKEYFYTPTDELNGAKSDDGYVWSAGFSVRMNANGTGAEIIGHGYRNSYEQVVNSLGDMFQSDNDDYSSCRNSYVLEFGSAGYYSLDGQYKWQADRRPGQAVPRAHWRQDNPGTFDAGDVYGSGGPTGVTFYENGALPAKFNGTYLSCEATRNVIFGYLPRPKGATYSLDRTNFLTTILPPEEARKETQAEGDARIFFRPSDIAVGPDGALYAADWYDARSGGHSTLDESASGAIYRIAPKGFKSAISQPDRNTAKGLVELLRNPAPNVRHIAFGPLKRMGEAALPELLHLLNDENTYVAARAVWLLPYMGENGKAKLEELLKDERQEYRLAAYRSLRRAGTNMLPYAKVMARDADAGVRRDVALSLRAYTAEQTVDIFADLVRGYDGEDKNYLEAIGLGAALKENEIWLGLKKRLVSGDALSWTDHFARLTWRLWPAAAVEDLKQRVSSTELSREKRLFAVESLAFIDDASAPDAIFELAEAINEPEIKEAIVGWTFRRGTTQWSKYDVGSRLKSSGIYDPDTIKLVPVSTPVPPPSKIQLAEVMALKGDAAKGAAAIMRCTMCHEINGVGPNYGPRLQGWAGKQTRAATITAIIKPSAGVAHGYKGKEYQLKDGTVIQGLPQVEGDPGIVMSQGGLTQMIPKSRVKKTVHLKHSLMMSADQLGLNAQDVADIVAYMKQWN